MYLYANIARAVALRAFQIEGGDATAREAAYVAASIATHMDGTEVPYHALRHDILAVGRELAAMVGNSSNALFRATLASQSSTLADGAAIPRLDSSGSQFIGAFDGYFDPATNPDMPMNEGTLQEVLRWVDDQASASPFFKQNPYKFAEVGQIVRHTTTNIYARGCSWDDTAQAAAFDTLPTLPATFTFVALNVNSTNNTITHTAHGLLTGAKVKTVRGTGSAALPTATPALTDGGTVFAIVVDANKISLAATLNDALSNVAIDFSNTGTDGSTPNSIVPVEPYGGGTCPLPQELEVLHWCKVLAVLPEENWFLTEGNFYRQLVADKEMAIIQGREQLLTAPDLADRTASVDPNKD